MNPKQIIEKIINDKRVSGGKLASEINASRATISHILKGNTESISHDLAFKINKKYPEYPIEYLKGDVKKYININKIETDEKYLKLADDCLKDWERLIKIERFQNKINVLVYKMVLQQLPEYIEMHRKIWEKENL